MTPRSALARLLALFRPHRFDRELDAEIQVHIEMAVEENLRAGMTPEAARRMAARSFGPAESMREEYRDALSLVAAPVLQSLLYGVAANDPLTLGITSALLFLSAAVATYFPVRRATRMDPITTLRED